MPRARMDSGDRAIQRRRDRPFLLRDGAVGDDAFAARAGARASAGGAEREPQVRARQSAARRPRPREGKPDEAIESWKRVEGAEPGVSAAGGREVAGRLPAARAASTKASACCAATSRSYPSLDLLNMVFQAVLEREGRRAPTSWCASELRRSADAAGAGQAARGAAAGSAGGAAPRPRADPQPRASAHAQSGAVPLRQLRLQGAAVLLALPGVPRLGDLSAAAQRGEGDGRVSYEARPTRRCIRARWMLRADAARRPPSALTRTRRLCARSLLPPQGRQGVVHRGRSGAG